VKICPQCDGTYSDDLTRCPEDGTGLLDLSEEKGSFVQERDPMQRLQLVEAPHGKYTIIEKIGQGGWGGVYKAFQHSTKRVVALKVLRKDVAEDPMARRRFHQEAQAVSRLKHPNTVTMFDFGETPDAVLFMAMEHVDGVNLGALIEPDEPMKPLRAVRVARQVALSLAEAHDQGIIHRDVKPLNIMLTELGEQKDFVKVLDFGVAKLLSSEATLTSTGSTFGTPEYMSPEQVQSMEIDHRSDLYSLGIILYEMLTGSPPFTGKSAVTVALAHARKKPPPINTHVDVYRPLALLVKNLLSKDPADRPQSAMEVAEKLSRIDAEMRLNRPREFRAAEAVRAAGHALVANWSAIVTVLAVVLLVVGGLLGIKKWLVKHPTVTAEVASTEAGAAHLTDTVDGAELDVVIGLADSNTLATPDGPSMEVKAEVSARQAEAVHAPELKPVPRDVTAQKDATGDAMEVRPEDLFEMTMQTDGGKQADVTTQDTSGAIITVVVTSNVHSAAVYRSNRKLCTTPCPLEGQEGRSKTVVLKKNGFLPAKKRIHFTGPGEVMVEMTPEPAAAGTDLKGNDRPSDEDGLK
jgi:tRNA A-37 threonylcarbamoyl transferase component Bud32